jgi:hypothetical protein
MALNTHKKIEFPGYGYISLLFLYRLHSRRVYPRSRQYYAVDMPSFKEENENGEKVKLQLDCMCALFFYILKAAIKRNKAAILRDPEAYLHKLIPKIVIDMTETLLQKTVLSINL